MPLNIDLTARKAGLSRHLLMLNLPPERHWHRVAVLIAGKRAVPVGVKTGTRQEGQMWRKHNRRRITRRLEFGYNAVAWRAPPHAESAAGSRVGHVHEHAPKCDEPERQSPTPRLVIIGLVWFELSQIQIVGRPCLRPTQHDGRPRRHGRRHGRRRRRRWRCRRRWRRRRWGRGRRR